MGKLVAEYGQKADGLGGVKYVQQDWQGSVRTVTNNNGFAIARTDHQAFGGDVGYGTGQRSIDKGYSSDPATLQGYGLTERDEASGQDHTWFRKNENSAGRWTSPDPYNGSMNLADPQSFNRFSYVTNDPVNFVDPTGLLLAITKCSGVTTTIKDDEGNVIAEWTDYRNCSQTFIGIGGSIGGSVGGTISISGGMGGGISSGPGPRRQPTSDPCAGKKGKIDPNDSAYPRAGLNHVADRHISPQSGQWIGKKSYFEFGLLFTKGSKSFTKDQRKGIVMGMFQDAFENGAPNRLGGGDYAYSYAPHMELVPGVAQIDFVGRDQRRNNDVTNVRTVVLDVKDCNKPKLSTGYPGLARPGDSVNGNPTWVGNTWTLPF
jgi:RHS repeat-associated protein